MSWATLESVTFDGSVVTVKATGSSETEDAKVNVSLIHTMPNGDKEEAHIGGYAFPSYNVEYTFEYPVPEGLFDLSIAGNHSVVARASFDYLYDGEMYRSAWKFSADEIHINSSGGPAVVPPPVVVVPAPATSSFPWWLILLGIGAYAATRKSS